MMNEPVSSIMTSDLITLSPDDSLHRAQEIFTSHRIHHLPVVDGDKLVGIITTYDLWKLNRPFSDYGLIKAKDVMTKKLAVIGPKAKVGTAAELFLANRFHAIPIVDEDKLVGIVTSFDVLRYQFQKAYPEPILYKEVYARKSSGVL